VVNLKEVREASGGVVYSNTGSSASNVKGKKSDLSKLLNQASISSVKDSFFYISYLNQKGEQQQYVFEFLPAIEANLQLSPNSSIRASGAQVPEVKPGVVDRISKRIKNQIIPGGYPVAQMVGIENNVIQLVGAFTTKDKLGTSKSPSTLKDNHTFVNAKTFKEEVVEKGKNIVLTLTTTNALSKKVKLEYVGLILNFKTYLVRYDRSYYTIDFLVTSYKEQLDAIASAQKEESEKKEEETKEDTKEGEKTEPSSSTPNN
jgi:hypothetical protein